MGRKFQGVNVKIRDDEKNVIGTVEVKFNDHKPLKSDYDFKSVEEAAKKLFQEVIKIMGE